MTKMLMANFTMPFVDAVVQALHLHYGTKASLQRPYLKSEESRPEFESDLALYFHLKAAGISGHFSLLFPTQHFRPIIARVYGDNSSMGVTRQGAKVLDFTNHIFKSVQTACMDRGFQLEKSAPLFVMGKSVNVRPMAECETMILPFQTEFGPFQIELSFERSLA